MNPFLYYKTTMCNNSISMGCGSPNNAVTENDDMPVETVAAAPQEKKEEQKSAIQESVPAIKPISPAPLKPLAKIDLSR